MSRKYKRKGRRSKAIGPVVAAKIIELRTARHTFGQIARTLHIHIETAKIYGGHIDVPGMSQHHRMDQPPKPPKTLQPWPEGTRFSSLNIPRADPRFVPPSPLGGGGASSLEGL